MVVLFLWLAVVYSLAYLKNAPLFEQNLNTIKENNEALKQLREKELQGETSWTMVDLQPIVIKSSRTNPEKQYQETKSPENTQDVKQDKKTEISLESWYEMNIYNSWSVSLSSWIEENIDHSVLNLLASTGSINLLSGTSQFFWVLDILNSLGLEAQYILKDSNEIYYANFWEKKIDVVRTVQKLGGDLYIMATEKEILDNQLFWDKITFINLPALKNKLVLMVLEINNVTWFIQVPYPQYHKNKAYLKSLFI